MEEQGLSDAFLASDARATAFLPADFRDAAARRAHVARAAARRGHLLEPGCAAVVTGQQIGLFLGPLYTFYKAATAIACARTLERETGTRCVPVFWLQTEDHDFAEIDHCWVIADGALSKLQLTTAPPERSAVKYAVLGPEVAEMHVPPLFAKHYRPGVTMVDAFAGVLRELFEADGLVIVDPRDHVRAAAPIHVRAIREAEAISNALQQREAELAAAGFEVQVKTRPGLPLSFFHRESERGARYRATSAELPLVEAHPERFSTSALLRPVLQDTLLPTAAYVGGPGELSYFAQLSPLYAHYGLPMPMVVPRARFRLIDPRTRERMRKAEPPRLEGVEAQLVAATDAVLAKIPAPRSHDVEDAVKLTRGTIARAASRLQLRYDRALSIADERERRVKTVLEPDGQPQERVLGLPTFLAKTDAETLKRRVLEAIDPWSPRLKDLEL